MKIKITEFGERHFDPKFGGTKILNMTKEEVEKEINNDDMIGFAMRNHGTPHGINDDVIVHDGYADFCKLVAVKNFTDAKVGSMPITLENYQYIRSGYSARRESELPVFSRWLELPLGKPKAEYLVFVLYSKEQIDKEAKVDAIKLLEKYYLIHDEEYIKNKDIINFEDWLKKNNTPISYEEFGADWGCVAILGQSHPNEEKMKPETMLRNALGVEEGGSGVPLDKEEYLKSVAFWSENATVK